MTKTPSVIIATSRLSHYAGAEIVTIDLAAQFSALGYDVTVAAHELSSALSAELSASSLKFLDLSGDSLPKLYFDLAWIHHHPTYESIFSRHGISATARVFSSLSHFEPLEGPPLDPSEINCYFVNSEENFEHFVAQYPELREVTRVLPNAAPDSFWSAYREEPAAPFASLLIVSNHPPTELLDAIPHLEAAGLRVEVIGVGSTAVRVTPSLLRAHSAVVTIGRTVPYCIASGVPVYCYDHFGGPGWISARNFGSAFSKNFSGRCTPIRLEASELAEQIKTGYEKARTETSELRHIGLSHLVQSKNLKFALRTLPPPPADIKLSPETTRRILLRHTDTYLNARREANMLAGQLDNQKASFGSQISLLESQANRLEVEIEVLRQDLQDAKAAHSVAEQHLAAMRASTSWRITASLRSVAHHTRSFLSHTRSRIGLARFLLQRSYYVLRHQGALALISKARRYARMVLGSRPYRKFQTTPDETESRGGSGLVSFVIPVYDRTDVLRTAIDSALSQSYSNIEVLIVTDGSPPETLNVVNEYRKDKRVRIFNFPSSSGNAVRGRNKGILEARGDYIAFLDSDDVAAPDRLALSLPILESGTADVVYGAWEAIVDGSRQVDGIRDGQIIYSPNADLESLIEACIPCQSTVTARRDLFFRAGFVKTTMQYREDHELWARLAYFGARFHALPHPLTKLRLHAGNNELNFKGDDHKWALQVEEEYRTAGTVPKKIVFILPGVGISGGIAVVAKHANMLQEDGHDVTLFNVGIEGVLNWYPDNKVPVVSASDDRRYLLDRTDLLFATGWSTADWLSRIDAKRMLYFVQSDERRFVNDSALKKKIEQSYRTKCEFLTEARWIQQMLAEEFGHRSYYVPNGIDLGKFYPDPDWESPNRHRIRVLIEGPIAIPFKGMQDAYAAVESLNCELWIVSSAGHPPKSWRYERFFEAVPFSEMRSIYTSCDVFLKMSRVEGFFGPPMEAMACGCAVVVGKVSGWDEYIVHEENALVVEQGDVDAARAAVRRLIDDSALRMRLQHGGFETVNGWSWERSRQAMRRVLEEVIDGREQHARRE